MGFDGFLALISNTNRIAGIHLCDSNSLTLRFRQRESIMKSNSRWHSVRYALKGVWHVVCHEWNARIELAAATTVIALGFYLKLGSTELAILVLTIGSVIAAEFANTVAESLVDLVSPEISEPARIIKDVAAGGVLVMALTSVVVGLFILGPPLLERVVG